MKPWFRFIMTSSILFVFSCSPQLKQDLPVENATEESFYKDGLRLLKKHDLVKAELKFHEAMAVNKNFAPAYEGLGLVAIERGELGEAEKFIDKAISLDREWIPARLARGRVLLENGAYEYALDEFKLTLKKTGTKKLPKIREQINFYLALTHLKLEDYEASKDALNKVLALNPQNEAAKNRLDHIEEYLGLIGGKASFLKQIASKQAVTRADLAVVLVAELKPEKIFGQEETNSDLKNNDPDLSEMNAASDVAPDFYAKSFIDKALEFGIMELLPDATFRPADKINRAEMAMVSERYIIKALNKPELESKYFKASHTPYKDVPPYYPIFNAVMLAKEYRIFDNDRETVFEPRKTISGFELFKIVKRMKTLR